MDTLEMTVRSAITEEIKKHFSQGLYQSMAEDYIDYIDFDRSMPKAFLDEYVADTKTNYIEGLKQDTCIIIDDENEHFSVKVGNRLYEMYNNPFIVGLTSYFIVAGEKMKDSSICDHNLFVYLNKIKEKYYNMLKNVKLNSLKETEDRLFA